MKKKKYQKIVRDIQDYTKRFEAVDKSRGLEWEKDELYSNGLISCIGKRTRKRSDVWVDTDGAEKNVVVFGKRHPFVIKINKYSANNDNSCYDEYQNYLMIKKAGFGDFCAETLMIDDKICVQEKVQVGYKSYLNNEVSETLFEYVYKKHYLELNNDFREEYPNYNSINLPIKWLKNAIAYHGAKRVVKFLKFIIGELKINDLHGGNVGYIGERPVVFDLSGYYSYTY